MVLVGQEIRDGQSDMGIAWQQDMERQVWGLLCNR